MRGKKITSADVAARAGVSQSAVSRVFTPGASASPRTAQKVRKAAAELGYRPNVIARTMASGRSRIIGLVVGYLENHFYPEALEALSTQLQERGYHVLMFMTSRTSGDVDEIVAGILDHQVDGIVAASVALGSELTARCRAAGVPVVLLNRSQDDPTLSAVTSDNVGGGRKVAELLLAGGHRRIAYIAGWEGASTQRDREFGFRAGLAEGGAALHSRAVGDFHLDGAREAARALFGGAARPDAVFVANDHMAFGVMDVLRFEMGLSVPGDVSVVGYDDVPPASWPAYDLTTVRQAPGRMVAETVSILIDRIEQGDDEPRRIAIAADLVLRGSARMPPGWSRTAGAAP